MVSTSLAPSMVFANHEFATNMTGQQEVPPVDTQDVGETYWFRLYLYTVSTTCTYNNEDP